MLNTTKPDINQDRHEIKKFNQYSQNWWKADASKKNAYTELHRINPVRLDFIQQYAHLQHKTVLDIGCGGGILSESLAKLGAIVTGIDVAENALASAKSHAKNSSETSAIKYYLTSAEQFAEKIVTDHGPLFDMITCMEMLEHVPDPEAIIRATAKLLKPQGKIFLSTLNRNLKAYLFAIIGAEWIANLLPKGTHDYAKFIRPSELSRCLRTHGFSVKAITGMAYHPLFKQYHLTADISVNYLLYAEKC